MAAEGLLTINRQITGLGEYNPQVSRNHIFNVTGTKKVDNTWTIGTTEEVLNVGDVTTLGRIYMLNRDPTNIVHFGPESGGVMVATVMMKPGEPCEMRLIPGVTYRGKAFVAACDVDVQLLSD